jgi:hypothetical protein
MHSNISCIWCCRPLAKAGGFQNVDILRSPPPSPTLPATSSWNRRDPWMLPCVFFPKASRRSSPGDPLRRSWPSGLHVASGMDMSGYMEDASCFIFTYSISTVGVTFFVFFFFISSIDLSALRDVSILNGRSLSCLYIIWDIVIFRPHKLCSQVVVRGNVSGHRWSTYLLKQSMLGA